MKKTTDYIQCESTEKTVEIHRGRNGYSWTGQKGKNLEWTIPVLVDKTADEILDKIYSCTEWQTYGKGRETSIDSPALREFIWNILLPHIDYKNMKIAETNSSSDRESMNRTQSKGKYVIETNKDIKTYGSNECYTFYQSVEFVVNWFLNNINKDYFKDKVVYLNADDTRSAFWVFFHNNFEILGLKELIATHYDRTGLSYGNSETNAKQFALWNEYDGYILRYDGKKIRRIPPEGMKSDFHGDFKEKICMDIARNEADIIMTNPPFGKEWENYVKAMLETGKKLIFWGNGIAPKYNWFMPLLNEKKIYIINKCSNISIIKSFMTPNYWKKLINISTYTTEDLSHLKPNKSHFSTKSEMLDKKWAWYDDNGILVCDNAKVPVDTDEKLAVSMNIIMHGILNDKYTITDYHRYDPILNGKEMFSRILIKRIK